MTQILYAYISEENHDYLIEKYLNEFPDDFKEKVLAYRKWQDSQLSLLGRLLLNHGLQRMGIKHEKKNLNYTFYNKPFLDDINTKFNISHSGEIVVCVLSDTNDVGIDVEIIDKINIQDFESQMTKSEWGNIRIAEDEKKAFFDYWTQKEAVIKANGKGLSIPLKSFEIANLSTKINDETFFLKEIFLDEKYKCHLAFKDKIDTIIDGPKLLMINEL